MNSKCPFLNQLRYCYASAEISSEERLIHIKFHQELNISTGVEAIQFLLKPLELDLFDCEYILSIVTPSMIYQSSHVTLNKGKLSVIELNVLDHNIKAS